MKHHTESMKQSNWNMLFQEKTTMWSICQIKHSWHYPNNMAESFNPLWRNARGSGDRMQQFLPSPLQKVVGVRKIGRSQQIKWRQTNPYKSREMDSVAGSLDPGLKRMFCWRHPNDTFPALPSHVYDCFHTNVMGTLARWWRVNSHVLRSRSKSNVSDDKLWPLTLGISFSRGQTA